MSVRPLNPFAAAFAPPATPERVCGDGCGASPEAAALSLCDLPPLVLQHVLRLLLSPADVVRCAATCRTVRAAVRTAALSLALSLPLQAAPSAPLLPSGLLARGWLHVSRLDLSGAFLAEEEVIAALSLPHLRHLSLLGCQKLTGEPPLLAALLAAPALASLAVQSCFSLRAASATALLAACLGGRCALQSLVLGSAALDFGNLLPGGEVGEPPTRSRLRLLALPSCELSGLRHAPAALGRAPLGALLLSGCAVVRVEAEADQEAEAETGAAVAEAPAADEQLAAEQQPRLTQLVVLESTQSPAGQALLEAGCVGVQETWDLSQVADAEAFASLGVRRLRSRLAAVSPAFGAVSEHELCCALAAAASAAAPPRRAAPLHGAAARGDATHVAALLALGARAEARDVAGATPLFVAAEAGAGAACAALLAAGAAIDARTASGEGPAYIAALKGRTDAARVLLSAAAERGLPAAALANGDGWTPLMAAAVAGRPGMLQLCAAAHGALDGTNRFGQTALHLAARRGSDELCGLLVRAGASPRVRDERGAAPADVAMRHGHADLAASLRAAAGPGKKERRRAQQSTPRVT
jgi:hypothetical protein